MGILKINLESVLQRCMFAEVYLFTLSNKSGTDINIMAKANNNKALQEIKDKLTWK